MSDLRAVLDAAEAAGEVLTVAQIAQQLSDRVDTEVSAQVVRRLKRSL